MREIMFTAPSDPTITKVTITAECLDGGEPIIERDAKRSKVKAEKKAR